MATRKIFLRLSLYIRGSGEDVTTTDIPSVMMQPAAAKND